MAFSSLSSLGFHYWLAGLASAITEVNTPFRRLFVGGPAHQSSLAVTRFPQAAATSGTIRQLTAAGKLKFIDPAIGARPKSPPESGLPAST
jgi:hypothetical protein